MLDFVVGCRTLKLAPHGSTADTFCVINTRVLRVLLLHFLRAPPEVACERSCLIIFQPPPPLFFFVRPSSFSARKLSWLAHSCTHLNERQPANNMHNHDRGQCIYCGSQQSSTPPPCNKMPTPSRSPSPSPSPRSGNLGRDKPQQRQLQQPVLVRLEGGEVEPVRDHRQGRRRQRRQRRPAV